MSKIPEHPTLLYSELSLTERCLYHVIVQARNHKDNMFYYNLASLSKMAGISRTSVINALNHFKELEIIAERERPGRSSIFRFCQYIPVQRFDRSDTTVVPEGYNGYTSRYKWQNKKNESKSNNNKDFSWLNEGGTTTPTTTLNYSSSSSPEKEERKRPKKLSAVENMKEIIKQSPTLLDTYKNNPETIYNIYPELRGWNPEE